MFKNIFFASRLFGRSCGVRRVALFSMIFVFLPGGMNVLMSCDSGRDSGDDALPRVVVSIPPLEYFARCIGGDSVRVSSLLPESSDPETFSPGISAMRELAASRVFVTTGTLPFEDALLSNIRSNNPGLQVVAVNDGIDLIYGTHSHDGAVGDHGHGHSGDADPHVWSSMKNAKIIADNVFDALVGVAPEHRGYFEERRNRLVARLDSLDNVAAEELLRSKRGGFAVWHPSLSYFARDYALEQIAFNAENKETSSRRLRSRLDEARRSGVDVLIVPSGVDEEKVAVVADGLGVEPVAVNLMSADWEGEMMRVAAAVAGVKF